MYKFRILTLNNEHDYMTWNQLVTEKLKNDPMLKASYYSLFSDHENCGMAAFYENDQGIIIYPFIKRTIPSIHKCYDIISAYGYSGPHTSGNITAENWKEFWERFDEWCHKSAIISEVIKFGLFGNEDCCYPGKIEEIMNNIVRPLNISITDLFRDYEHKVRKNVKRAIKYGLVFEDSWGNTEDFLKIYYETMDRKNADKKYYFSRNFFESLYLVMKENCCTFFVTYNGIPISTELVLLSDENIYSYLGGTVQSYFEMRPNDFLKSKIIEWGHKKGYKNYILGGGYGEEDGIYRYKKSFAPNGIKKFEIGSRKLDTMRYEQICTEKGIDPNDNYIPAYRLERNKIND